MATKPIKPILYMFSDGGIANDATICSNMVPAVVGTHVPSLLIIAPKLQQKGIAVLSYNDTDICIKNRLDGVYYMHISPKEFKNIRTKNPELQLGVFCGSSRHMAMVMGEKGADFIVFNNVDCVSWWVQLMEIAVVYDITANSNTDIAEGADFILKRYM